MAGSRRIRRVLKGKPTLEGVKALLGSVTRAVTVP